ncbi:MAG: hypothetical protein ACXVCO_18515 [Ktedonobacterales bacterium]
MSSAGFSGTSNSDRTNTPGGDAMRDQGTTPESAAMDESLEEVLEEMEALGDAEPVGIIEIAEVETPDTDLEPEGSRFRWWYVPAAALPIAAGATAGAIWLAQRNRRRRVRMYQRLALQGRGLLAQVPFRRKARPATVWQQGIATVRGSAKGLPDQASALRDRSAEMLAAIDTAALLAQTRDIWSNALDQMNSLWGRTVPGGRRARRRARRAGMMLPAGMMRGQIVQMRRQLVRMRRRGRAARVTSRVASIAAMRMARVAARSLAVQARINRWIGRQQERQRIAMTGAKAAGRASKVAIPLAAAARSTSKAVMPVASTARATRRGMQKTRRSVNRGFKQARAFSFGVLVASIVTYVRVWRARLDERELRETASGRLVRDPSGPVDVGVLP